MLWLLISKVNIETLEKFDALIITQCQYYCVLLLIVVLHTCIDIKNINDNQMLDFNDKEKNKVELGDALSQKILKDQEVTYGRDYILIVTILLYMLCYTRN